MNHGLSIQNRNTEDALLCYDGRPAMLFGSLPEIETFAADWNSEWFNLEKWIQWMKRYGMNYGRVYPESGIFHPDSAELIHKDRLFPFEIAHWDENRPIFDLTRLSERYWANMEKVIHECAKNDIVIHLQMYQRCYFTDTAWNYCFFHPQNNINQLNLGEWEANGKPSGGNYWQKSLTDERIGSIHETYVKRILQAIGNHTNVLLDLMNEPGEWQEKTSRTKFGVGKEWVEKTLDIIENWERRNENRLIKGLYVQFKSCQFADYIYSHPCLDLFFTFGQEIFGEYNTDYEAYRRKYKKPVISAHNGGRLPRELKSYLYGDDFPRKRNCQWACMLQKIQGIGIYAKNGSSTDLQHPNVQEYGKQTEFLRDFYTAIQDYASLKIRHDCIAKSPGVFKYALVSPAEAVIYLHTKEYGERIPHGYSLLLKNLEWTGMSDLHIVLPQSGKSLSAAAEIVDGEVSIALPGFQDDIAVRIARKVV